MSSRTLPRAAAARAAVPGPGEGKRGEAGYLAYLLRQAAGGVRLRLERGLAGFDVTAAQFVVLTMLEAYPDASGADIARLTLLTPQTVHGITNALERAALIARLPHPTHRRVQRLALTAAGRALLARCKKAAQALDATLAAGLTAREEATVRRWLVNVAVADESGKD